MVQQDLLRALILQKNPAGSEAGAGSEAMSKVLFLTEAGAPVEAEANLRSLSSIPRYDFTSVGHFPIDVV